MLLRCESLIIIIKLLNSAYFIYLKFKKKYVGGLLIRHLCFASFLIGKKMKKKEKEKDYINSLHFV